MAGHWFETKWVVLFLLLVFVGFFVLLVMWSTAFGAFDASVRSDVGGANDNFPPFYAPAFILGGDQTLASLSAGGYSLDPAEYISATIVPVKLPPPDLFIQLAFALRDPYTDTTNRQILITSDYDMEIFTSDGTVHTVPSGIGIRCVATFNVVAQEWLWEIS